MSKSRVSRCRTAVRAALSALPYAPTGKLKIDGLEGLRAPGDGIDATGLNPHSPVAACARAPDRTLAKRIYVESLAAEKHSPRYFYSSLPLSQTSSRPAGIARSFGRLKSMSAD
jgi:hypothetical protein